jgi:quinol monooxygenase YgiN
MIIRVVRMHFKESGVEDFLKIFDAHKKSIRHFPGCTHLQLLKDPQKGNIFSTLSHWNDPQDLENYRQSELFESVWSRVKPLFAEKTQAFSFEKFIEVD